MTFLKKGSEAFQVVNCSLIPALDEYTDKVKSLTKSQSVFFGGEDYPEHQLIYASCLPWIDMMSSSSEHFLNPDDAIPRIARGNTPKEQTADLRSACQLMQTTRLSMSIT